MFKYMLLAYHLFENKTIIPIAIIIKVKKYSNRMWYVYEIRMIFIRSLED